jgi:hydrogenase expression/formation protein HypE
MKKEIITLQHGSGGRPTQELIERLILPRFSSPALRQLLDSALVECSGRIAFTTDAFVVRPIFFPGGDIGKLAVSGAVNDLAAVAAEPLFLAASFVLEEGLEVEELDRVLESMSKTCKEAGIALVAGDTKVVEKGAGDKIYISTSAIGVRKQNPDPQPALISPGDVIIVTGPIGEHGMAVLQARENFFRDLELESDCAPIWPLIDSLLKAGLKISAMRDPTRGGLATTLSELARDSRLCLQVDEGKIPIGKTVQAACDMLGLDPMYLACEGRMVIVLPQESAGRALEVLRGHPLAQNAALIGECLGEPQKVALLSTRIGGRRILQPLSGEQLPRIC